MPTVDLWQWSLDVPSAQIPGFSTVLSEDEVLRAGRFVKPRDRNRYVAGRSKLREVLGTYLGVTAEAVAFEYGPHGKPILADGLGFNLSHSGGRAVLAVCEKSDLGVDIEELRPIDDAVARHHFSKAEYSDLSALPKADWLNGFYRCWTRKEAVLKMLGHGLFMPLNSFDVTLSSCVPAKVTRIEGDDPARWSLQHIQPNPGFVGALALRDAEGPVKIVWRDTTRHTEI